MVQIKKNIGKCEILPLALHLVRTGHIYISNRRVYQQISVKPINLVKMDSSLFNFQMRFGII